MEVDNGPSSLGDSSAAETSAPIAESEVPTVFKAICRSFPQFLDACLKLDDLIHRSTQAQPLNRPENSSDAIFLGTTLFTIIETGPQEKAVALTGIVQLLDAIYKVGTDGSLPNKHHQDSDAESATSLDSTTTVWVSLEEPQVTSSMEGNIESGTNYDYVSKLIKPNIDLAFIIKDMCVFLYTLIRHFPSPDFCEDFLIYNGLEKVVKFVGLPDIGHFSELDAFDEVVQLCYQIMLVTRKPDLVDILLNSIHNSLVSVIKELGLDVHNYSESVVLQVNTDAMTGDDTKISLLESALSLSMYCMFFNDLNSKADKSRFTVQIMAHSLCSPKARTVFNRLCLFYGILDFEHRCLSSLFNTRYSPVAECFSPQWEEYTNILYAKEKSEAAFKENLSGLLHFLQLINDPIRKHFYVISKIVNGYLGRQMSTRQVGALEDEMLLSLSSFCTDLILPLKEISLCPIISDVVSYGTVNLGVCANSVRFAGSLLFDHEGHHRPYYCMLHCFAARGGFHYIFEILTNCLTIGETETEAKTGNKMIPTNAAEYVEACLELMEKLTNVDIMMRTNFDFPAPFRISFSPTRFLVYVQRKSLKILELIWGLSIKHNFRKSISIAMIKIIMHIVAGEARMGKVNSSKNSNSSNPGQSSSNPAPPAATLSPESLNILTGMGFPRQLAEFALQQYSDVHAAIDYLLSSDRSLDSPLSGSLSMNTQPLPIYVSVDQAEGSSSDKDAPVDPAFHLLDFSPYEESVTHTEVYALIKDFMQPLEICKSFPSVVYTCAEFLVLAISFNEMNWVVSNVITPFIAKVEQNFRNLKYRLEEIKQAEYVECDMEFKNFTAVMHLFLLVFEKRPFPMIAFSEISNSADMSIHLLEQTIIVMQQMEKKKMPKWVTLLLIFMDEYEKVMISLASRMSLKSAALKFKYRGYRDMQWNNFSDSQNASLVNGYRDWKTHVQVTRDEISCLVDLRSMTPVPKGLTAFHEVTLSVEPPITDNIDPRDMKLEFKDPSSGTTLEKYIPRMAKCDFKSLISVIISLLKLPLDPEMLRATMTLCLRITRKQEFANMFAKLGGPSLLLMCPKDQEFSGCVSLATLIFRHIFETRIITTAMDQVIQETIDQKTHEDDNVHSILKILGPAVCRDTHVFQCVAMSRLRFSVQHHIDNDYSDPVEPDSFKYYKEGALPRRQSLDNVDHVNNTESLIHLLLNFLASDSPEDFNSTDISTSTPMDCTTSSTKFEKAFSDVSEIEIAQTTDNVPESFESKQLIMKKSTVLIMLSEFVRSYPECAEIVIAYKFAEGSSSLITRDCSAVSFILETFILPDADPEDRHSQVLSMLLIVSLVACRDPPRSEFIIQEIKQSLIRVLGSPEGEGKCRKIRMMCSIVCTIIQACSETAENIPIAKIMLEADLLTILSRVLHFLDFSKNNVRTINRTLLALRWLTSYGNGLLRSNSPSARIWEFEDDLPHHSRGGFELERVEYVNLVDPEDEPEYEDISGGEDDVYEVDDDVLIFDPGPFRMILETPNPRANAVEIEPFRRRHHTDGGELLFPTERNRQAVNSVETLHSPTLNERPPEMPARVPPVHPLMEARQSNSEQTHRNFNSLIVGRRRHMAERDPDPRRNTMTYGPPPIYYYDTHNRISTQVSQVTTNEFEDGYFLAFNLRAAIPSIQERWAEESSLLDGNTVNDIVAYVKPKVLLHLEECRRKQMAKETDDSAVFHVSPEPPTPPPTASASTSSNNQSRELIRELLNRPPRAGSSSSQLAESSSRWLINDNPSRQRQFAIRGRGSNSRNRFQELPPRFRRREVPPRFQNLSPPVPMPAEQGSMLDPIVIDDISEYSFSSEEEFENSNAEEQFSPASPIEIELGLDLHNESQSSSGMYTFFEALRDAGEVGVPERHTCCDHTQNDFVACEQSGYFADVDMISEPDVAELEDQAPPRDDVFRPAAEADQSMELGSGDGGDMSVLSEELTPAVPTGSSEPSNGTSEPGPSTQTNENGESSQAAQSLQNSHEAVGSIDPSFLAALPEHIRTEVLFNQMHLRQENPPTEEGATGNQFPEIDPDYLAALPLHIQNEVLEQQQRERDRITAAELLQSEQSENAAHFLQNLPENLRQQVLSDIQADSLQMLTPDLQEEARRIRRVHYPVFLRRIASQITSNSALDVQTRRFLWEAIFRRRNRLQQATSLRTNAMVGNSKPNCVLDCDSLACIIVILFLYDDKIYKKDLHKVLVNLSVHEATRHWVVESLMSVLELANAILDKCKFVPLNWEESGKNSTVQPKKSSLLYKTRENRQENRQSSPASSPSSKSFRHFPKWLTMKLGMNDIQLDMFWNGQDCLVLHVKAYAVICKQVLDALALIAKSFPLHFLPQQIDQKTNEQSDISGAPKDIPLTLGPVTRSKKGHKASKLSANPVKRESPTVDFLQTLQTLDRSHNKTDSSNLSQLDSASKTMPKSESRSTGFYNSGLARLIRLMSVPFYSQFPYLRENIWEVLSQICLSVSTESQCSLIQVESNDGGESSTGGEMSVDGEMSVSDETNAVTEANISNETNADVAANAVVASTSAESNIENIADETTTRPEPMSTNPSTSGETPAADPRLSKQHRHLPLKSSLYFDADDEAHFVDHLKILEKVIVCEKSSPEKFDHIELVFLGLAEDCVKTQQYLLQTAISAAKSIGLQMEECLCEYRHLFLAKKIKKAIKEGDTDTASIDVIQCICSGDHTKQRSPTEKVSTVMHGIESKFLQMLKIIRSTDGFKRPEDASKTNLSSVLNLQNLWNNLSTCLNDMPSERLSNLVEAFFIVHSSPDAKKKETLRHEATDESSESLPFTSLQSFFQTDETLDSIECGDSKEQEAYSSDLKIIMEFSEKHKAAINKIIRKKFKCLSKSPFAVLKNFTHLLDFDIRRSYFQEELRRRNKNGYYKRINVHVQRQSVFLDSYRLLHRKSPKDWMSQFVVKFRGEPGQDAGGVRREWYTIIAREIFNPMYALFAISPGDRVTYMINQSSDVNPEHLSYFKFVGRIIAKAISENNPFAAFFTRSFYKHILGKHLKYTDMQSEDYTFYQGLVFLLEHGVKDLGHEPTFSIAMQEFGATEIRDLKPNGRNIAVTEENKREYVRLVCQEKMTGSIRQQLQAFLSGFYDIIPKKLISIFNEQELELLISGTPEIDLSDLEANTVYYKYSKNSPQIQWFWQALKTFNKDDLANVLQFVTGTSRVPLQGFVALQGMNGPQKFQIHRDEQSTNRLPSAHTCFNQLDLPAYESYDKLRHMLLKAVHECPEGFGFA